MIPLDVTEYRLRLARRLRQSESTQLRGFLRRAFVDRGEKDSIFSKDGIFKTQPRLSQGM